MVGMSERPTIYESAARRRGRRIRGAVLGALVAVLAVVAAAGAAVVLLRGDEGAAAGAAGHSPSPSASPAKPALRLSRLAGVEVRRGEKATVRYRVTGPSGR